MNDMFLYQSKPRIREGFSNELLARLATNSTSPWEEVKSVLTQIRKPKIFAPMILLLTIFVACAQQFLSPEYHLEAEIGSFYVYESNYKIVRLDHYDFSSPPFTSGEVHNFYEKPIPSQYPTIEEALELYPVPFNWPIYAPEGYQLTSNTFQPYENLFYFNYVNADGNVGIHGMVFVLEEKITIPHDIMAAPKKWKSIEIKDVPAIILYGDFEYPSIEELIALNEDGKKTTHAYWKDDLGLRLFWIIDNVRYQLSTPGLLGFSILKSDDRGITQPISEEELIRMAESMIP